MTAGLQRVCGVLLAAGLALASGAAAAAQQMPNPKEISGVPLPSADTPAGSLSVRVVRGDFSNNIAGQPVEFTVDGKTQTITTDASGHAQVSGLKPGARVRVLAVVAGERLQSQEVTIAMTGIRVVLVATDPDAVKREAEDRALAQGPAVKGLVVFGPESRVVLEFTDERLNVFYVLDVLNTARTPVDIGGPLQIDLPAEARGASLMEGSSKQATVKGPHVTVTGPFPPGSTSVQVAYELPFTGGTARLDQKWPALLQQTTVLAPQSGGLTIRSPQLASVKEVQDQGQTLILGAGGALQAGQTLALEISGLPHHAVWPRYTALAMAGAVMAMGIWAAIFVKPRHRTA